MNTFHLLSLPTVPLREVLNLWNPIEIVEFSFCSKKTYTIAKKNLNKSKNLSLEIHEYRKRQITIFVSENSFEIAIAEHDGHMPEGSYNAVINKLSVNIVSDTNAPKLTTYWKDEIIGLNELIKYIVDIFNYPVISTVRLDTKHKNLPLPQWINQQYHGKVKHFFIETNNTDASEADIKLLLDSCKLSRIVVFRSRPLTNFQYEFNYDMVECFALQFAEWITLNHLIVLTNQVVYLFLADTSLSNQDFNAFLKAWISSESVLKTKKLMVRGSKVNIDEIFMGIEREEEDPDFIGSLPITYGILLDAIPEGFNIYRKNGDKALIITQTSNNTVLVEMRIQSD